MGGKDPFCVPLPEAAVGGLAEALKDEDARVRGWAAEALGKSEKQAQSATLGLCGVLRDSDTWARNRACYSLGEIGDARAVPHLIEKLDDAEGDVREAAGSALGVIGGPAAKDAIPQLREQLEDSHKEAREAAREALYYIEKDIRKTR